MNKSEFIDAIAAKVGMPKSQVAKFIDAYNETVVKTVAKGQDVRLIGFGTFKAVDCAPRTGRNPTTGDSIQIPTTRKPRFIAGSYFKEIVNAGADTLEDQD